MNTIEYKSYIAKIEYDDETESFQARTINAQNTISFYGYSAEELKANFHVAVDTYLEACQKKNIEPAKALPGQLRVRFDPDLHAKISHAASMRDESLNSFIAHAAQTLADQTLAD